MQAQLQAQPFLLSCVGTSLSVNCGAGTPITNRDPPSPSCTSFHRCPIASTGQNVSIPCGEIEPGLGVEFTYLKDLKDALNTTVGEILQITVTPEYDGSNISCTSNVSKEMSCYELIVQCKYIYALVNLSLFAAR